MLVRFAALFLLSSTEPHPLTVPEVIEMAQAGYSEEYILDRIRTAHPEASVPAILALTQAGLSERIVRAAAGLPFVGAAAAEPKSEPAPKVEDEAKDSLLARTLRWRPWKMIQIKVKLRGQT